MKNAFVLAHHFGADGNFPAGTVMLNLPNQKFEDLGPDLVREATAAEVAAAKGEPAPGENVSKVIVVKPKPAPKAKRTRRVPSPDPTPTPAPAAADPAKAG